MNCRRFETLVGDLAREQMMAAALRTDLLAHAAQCERCAARLAAERKLTTALKALGAMDRANIASNRLESTLIAEFRRGVAPPRARRLPSNRWIWAIAAGLLLTIGVLAYRSLPERKPMLLTQDPGATIPAPLPETKPPTGKRSASETIENNSMSIANRTQAKSPTRRLYNKPTPRQTYVIRDEITTYASMPEYASDFFMLDSGGEGPMDRGQIIRVEVPRPALVRMGLPINAELADIPMKADLLVGEDGLARAIRFIR